jgi:hypothetical protein
MDNHFLQGAVQHGDSGRLDGPRSRGRRSAMGVDRGGEAILCRRNPVVAFIVSSRTIFPRLHGLRT